ncbi:hypothetical protein AG1IA_04648 [Rhizoctonia solani AG-1 IA]|uniref:Uncharacterized protein n=1 Tax=Thanatephorus cucumeris (strain AG1-IA) TaxID=983506 RepID=L8WX27_THACA|nr:hypothetical protein AG1IA_04648 [Rhizoctonia solani AG-1 IA]
MKSKLLAQTGCGTLAYAVAVFGLPQSAGHKMDRLRPRHSASASGSATRTVMVTVSLGPSTTVTLGGTNSANPCTDENMPILTTSTTIPSGLPNPIVSTITLTTEILVTILPSAAPPFSSPLSSGTSVPTTALPAIITTSSALPTTSSTSSSIPPISTDPNFNPITAPAIGGGNVILAQNAAQAQALNRKFRELTFSDSCLVLGRFDRNFMETNRCGLNREKAIMQAAQHSVPCSAIGCYTEADLEARFSSTGRSGNAFGE